MTDLDGELRESARREATPFDEELHARVMARVARAPAAAPPPARRVGPSLGVGLLAAAAAAAIGLFLAWPAGPARPVPALPWEADRAVARAYRSLDAIPPSDLGLGRTGSGVSRFLAGQFEMVTSLRPAPRPAAERAGPSA